LRSAAWAAAGNDRVSSSVIPGAYDTITPFAYRSDNEQAAEALRASDDLARQLLTTVGTSLHLPRSISGRILSRRSQVLRQPPLEASR
jgi:hypothetical protein